jgi:DNA mismatch repair protein MutL
MKEIIHILSETVANQIAAGEVVQRPASVVKELMENALDAGSTRVEVRLKEGGKNLIQVADNGKGMNPTDARMAFKRHATSKLKLADDLFHLKTMGFRGEALASIAAVALVELVTRRASDELAWKIELEGSSEPVNEEPTLFAQGTRITVRNLFYNIPARRKFLGDTSKELKFVRDEFIQIALVHPDISLTLTHNDEVLYQLVPSSLKQRILTLFGKRSGGQLNKQLYPVDVKTQLINITGFTGDPAAASQRDPIQYFFVNGRFIRHKFFRSAVLKAYETLLPAGMQPVYLFYFEVDTEALDVNIHPTKTEVKFEHEQAIWPIIHAAVREALGKFNATPSIDFDKDDAPEIGIFTGERAVSPPPISYNPSYNPFKQVSSTDNQNWEALFDDFHNESNGSRVRQVPGPRDELSGVKDTLFDFSASLPVEVPLPDESGVLSQLFASYIVQQTPQALLLIQQRRAHIRVLFDRFMKQLVSSKAFSQQLVFPVQLEFDTDQLMDFMSVSDTLKALGFGFTVVEPVIIINAVPTDIPSVNVEVLLPDLMASIHEFGMGLPDSNAERMALKLAKTSAITLNKVLSPEEMAELIRQLMLSKEPSLTPDGKLIISQISLEDIKSLFK